MSYFKKFTDICAGAAAFLCALFFIRNYMAFDPDLSEKAPGKLEQFLKSTETANYKVIITLTLLLLLSVAVGVIFRKLPYVCFGASLIPAAFLSVMVEHGSLYNEIALVIILTLLHVVGNLVDCITRDNEDGRHRLWICAKISSAMGAFFCFYTIWLSKGELPKDTKALEELGDLERSMLLDARPLDLEVISNLFWMFAVLLVISLLLYNVYFIDAILALPPAIYVIHGVTSGNLGVATYLFITVSLICAISHLMLAIFENNLSTKEQLALKERENKE